MIPDSHVLVPIGERGFCVRALRMHQVQQGHGVFQPQPGQSFVFTALYNTKGRRVEHLVVDVQCLVEPDDLTPCRQILLMDQAGGSMTISLGSFFAAGPQIVNRM